jgi:hypothetical protein
MFAPCVTLLRPSIERSCSQRHVSQHDDRRARSASLEIAFQPFQLPGAEPAEVARLQIEHVDARDEMRAVVVEAVPPAIGASVEALEECRAVVAEHIVLAGHVVHRSADAVDDLLRNVELLRLRQAWFSGKVDFASLVKEFGGDDERLTITGETREFVRPTDAGHQFFTRFCPTCGTSLFWRSNRNPGMTGIAVGAFADPLFPAPVRSVWERSRRAWVEVPAEDHFDKGRLPK